MCQHTLEAVKGGTAFTTTITFDSYLLKSKSAQLGFTERSAWIGMLPGIARKRAGELLRAERKWSLERNYVRLTQFYEQMLTQLQDKERMKGSFFVQIGWGGGWQTKTIGRPLQADAQAWERLLGKGLKIAPQPRKFGDPFPKSRRVVVTGGTVAVPLGWCLVEMKEKK